MKKLVLTSLMAVAVALSFGQKKNVSQAGLTMRDMDANKQKGDFESLYKNGLEAKEYIDLAANHEETKNLAKTHWYKGKIYIELAVASQMMAEGSAEGMDAEKLMTEGLESLKKSKEIDAKKRYVDDVNNYVAAYRAQFTNMGITSFDEGNYEAAMGGLLGGALFADVMGDVDSVGYFYGGLAAVNAKQYEAAYEALGKSYELGYNPGDCVQYMVMSAKELGKSDEEVETLISEAKSKYPSDLGVMIQVINHYIDTDRKDDAAKALEGAIALDPDNVALMYTSGNIYEEMGNTDAAEKAFLKAVELAPKNVDALYPLGVHYFNRGADKNNEANKMELGDPNYEPYLAEADEFFKKSLTYLERASEAAPEDIDVLESLKLVYGKLKMMDKFKETKAKIQSLKNG